MTAVISTDRPKSVRNRCVIELFGGVFFVVTLLFGLLSGCRVFLSQDWVRSLPFSFKIKLIDGPIVAEFNYKLFNHLFCDQFFLSIWKIASPLCTMCTGTNENTKHLIFEWVNIQNLWKILCSAIKFDIQSKHIVIGLCLEYNEKVSIFNKMI